MVSIGDMSLSQRNHGFANWLRLFIFLLPVLAWSQATLESARRLRQQGSLRNALQAYEAILPAHPGEPQVLLELAQTAMALGEYPRAIDASAQAGNFFRKKGDSTNEALASNVAASSYLYSGDYASALRDFQHALEIDRSTHDAKGEITRLSNIGNVYFFQGKYLDALEYYQLGMRRVEETAAESWNPSRRQLVLANLAILYQQLGQNQKALDYYQLAQSTGAALPPAEYAQLLSNVGTIYRRLGDPVKALRNYQDAQAYFNKETLSAGQIHILQNIGIVYALDLHDLPRALDAFGQALKLAAATTNRRETVLAHLFRGEAFFRLERIPEATRDFEDALAGAHEIGAAEEQWTAHYSLGRIHRRNHENTRALDSFRQALNGIESVRSALGSAGLKAEFLANKRDVYDAAIDLLLETSAATPAQLFDLIERARSRNFQDALRSRMTLPSFAELERRLDPHSLLIEYWVGPARLAALWVAGGKSGIVTRDMSPADTAAIRQFATALPAARNSEWRLQAAQIGGLLLAGIPITKPMANVLIVPDGLLNLLPFEALSTAAGKPLLLEQFAVSYLPSAALLPAPGSQSPAPAFPWRRQLVAFGDPVATDAGVFADDRAWMRLPQSARELRAVSSPLRGRAQVHAAAGNLKSRLTGGAADGAALLHFSTHAVADPVDSNRSRILFSPERGSPGSEYLFWPEVAALKLSGVDLVTLSACDTEAGRMVRGEGVQSFSRAFLAAGARSTVTTLWRVADSPTADFMGLFYRNLARGESKAEALRNAKLDFLHAGGELAQPQYWAAFVFNGDGRASIPRVISWIWIFDAVVVLALLIWAYRYYRRPRHSSLRDLPAAPPAPL
jgi:CHAT domain-containing protein/Tfp pilus assembly protein PilF